MKNYKYFLLVFLCALLAYFLIQHTNISLGDLFQKCFDLGLEQFVVIYIIHVIHIWFIAIRWKIIVKNSFTEIKFVRGFFFYYTCMGILASFFLSNTLGYISTRAYSLKNKHDVSVLEGSNTGVVEHVLNLLVIAVMYIPSLLFFMKILTDGYAIIFNIVLLLLIVVVIAFFPKIFINLLLIPKKVLKKFLLKIPKLKKSIDIDENTIKFIESNRMYPVKIFIFSILVIYASVAKFYIFASVLNVQVPLMPFILVFPFAYIVSVTGLTPGSLGMAEMGWLGSLLLIHVTREDAAVFLVGQRIYSTGFAVLVFFASFVVYNFFLRYHKFRSVP